MPRELQSVASVKDTVYLASWRWAQAPGRGRCLLITIPAKNFRCQFLCFRPEVAMLKLNKVGRRVVSICVRANARPTSLSPTTASTHGEARNAGVKTITADTLAVSTSCAGKSRVSSPLSVASFTSGGEDPELGFQHPFGPLGMCTTCIHRAGSFCRCGVPGTASPVEHLSASITPPWRDVILDFSLLDIKVSVLELEIPPDPALTPLLPFPTPFNPNHRRFSRHCANSACFAASVATSESLFNRPLLSLLWLPTLVLVLVLALALVSRGMS